MMISDPHATLVCDEREIYESLLPLAGADILELGCGKADKTRAISQTGKVKSITALEVDTIQHAANQQRTDLPAVRFQLGGAEAIPAPDEAFDIVLMFKSLHHVPVNLMDQAMAEIRRVLKPGGMAYISEPIFAGDFNEVLRLFHDEKSMRQAAFAAIDRAVGKGDLELVSQKFFSTPGHFDSFEQFEERILNVTHTRHQLSPELYQQVKAKFMQHMTPQGADFENPLRVDLLRKA
ncbi:MAG: class I SAM-dependent methyltransferase [Sulfuricella denitrificans]|nr:class I SAM-dependent methyltransferase [Sulfuricella denitrificans]